MALLTRSRQPANLASPTIPLVQPSAAGAGDHKLPTLITPQSLSAPAVAILRNLPPRGRSKVPLTAPEARPLDTVRVLHHGSWGRVRPSTRPALLDGSARGTSPHRTTADRAIGPLRSEARRVEQQDVN